MDGQVLELATNPLANAVADMWATTLGRAERFVVLVLDDISLIVAQQEIRALEPVLDVQTSTTPNGNAKHANAAGTLTLAGGVCHVYSLDGELKNLPKIPESHRICAIMNHRDIPYALSCKEVRLLQRSLLSLREIPKALLPKKTGNPAVNPGGTPIKCLVINENNLLLGTTATALFAHLARIPDAEIISFEERLRRPRT